MKGTSVVTRYGSTSILIHWLMVLLFVAIYACINLHELFPKGSEIREDFKTWHFMLGLLAFAFLWLRLIAIFFSPKPDIPSETPKWQLLSAKLVHLALYALMIGMPLSGWLMLSAAGKPIPFFGLELPSLLDTNKALASQIKEVHEFIGNSGYFLIGIHAVAALYHHYIQRDNTLNQMLLNRRG